MKDWAVSFIAAVFGVGFIVGCVRVFVQVLS